MKKTKTIAIIADKDFASELFTKIVDINIDHVELFLVGTSDTLLFPKVNEKSYVVYWSKIEKQKVPVDTFNDDEIGSLKIDFVNKEYLISLGEKRKYSADVIIWATRKKIPCINFTGGVFTFEPYADSGQIIPNKKALDSMINKLYAEK